MIMVMTIDKNIINDREAKPSQLLVLLVEAIRERRKREIFNTKIDHDDLGPVT